jgi:sugar phosphate isomerase/epimerase
MKNHTRRAFLAQSIAVATTASLLKPSFMVAVPAAHEDRAGVLRLGGPSFAKTEDPDELATAHRKLGYRAAYCPNVSLKDPEKVKAFAQAFARQDVVIAEVGRWCNLMESDADKRRANIETVIEGLALAEAIGARCCVDIAGSFHPISWFGPHPDNFSPRFFDAAVENARKIIDAIKPQRSRFCYEMMGWALPDTADNYLRLIKAVDRKAFGVHLDPCNAINSPEKFFNNTALLNECFDKLGEQIVSCHAKDLSWEIEMNIHFKEVIPGKGTLDYTTYLRRLAKLPQNPPLMLEHLSTADEYAQGRDHILRAGREAGLSFG